MVKMRNKLGQLDSVAIPDNGQQVARPTELNRLKDLNRNSGGYTQAWTLDALGNWASFNDNGTAQTRTSNLANEITNVSTDGTNQPAYDATGSTTKDKNFVYKYDGWKRTAEVRQRSDNALVATYAYDPKHRRIEKTLATGNVSTEYYYDDGGNDSLRVLEITKDTGSGAATYEAYVWCERFVHAPVCRLRDTNADGTADETLYATADANYNITALVDTTGTVVERFVYDPYGKVSICNNDATWTQKTNNASGYDWCVLYTGHKLDTETATATSAGNYYANARYYNPELGRFLSRDPLGYIDGMNVYEYVGSDPIVYHDSSGEALAAFDGTNNTKASKTNISIMFENYNGNKAYMPGVGTIDSFPTFAAWKGWGLLSRSEKMKKWLECIFKTTNDRDVDIIGFSRGAANARHFSNDIKDLLVKYKAKIRFIGVFDTVPATGEKLNMEIPTAAREATYHALSMHERRYKFVLKRLGYKTKKNQVWFWGGHSDIGGGFGAKGEDGMVGLQYITLHWMTTNAVGHGVPLRGVTTKKFMFDRKKVEIHDLSHELPFSIHTYSPFHGYSPRKMEAGDTYHASVPEMYDLSLEQYGYKRVKSDETKSGKAYRKLIKVLGSGSDPKDRYGRYQMVNEFDWRLIGKDLYKPLDWTAWSKTGMPTQASGQDKEKIKGPYIETDYEEIDRAERERIQEEYNERMKDAFDNMPPIG